MFLFLFFLLFLFFTLGKKVGFFLLLRTPPYITLPIFILITHRVYFVVFLTAVKYRRLKVCINFISSYFMGNIDGPFLSGESSNFEVMGVLFRREKRLLVWFLLLEWLLLLWLWLWRLVGTFWGSGVFEENM